MKSTNHNTTTPKTPSLRFPGFSGEWEEKKFGDFLNQNLREVKKPSSKYKAIGIRSHFKGTFQKPNNDPNTNLMNSLFVVKEGDFIVNITFAWEGALAIATKDDEDGFVSHRFPTYTFDNKISEANFFRFVFPTKRNKYLLGTISPGGAGRNRVLNRKDLLNIKVKLPTIDEQKKITSFLSAVDEWIANLREQKQALLGYKRGLMQKIFPAPGHSRAGGNPEIRFKSDDGTHYPDWEEKRLGDIASFSKGQGVSKADIKSDGKYKCIRYGELYTSYGEVIREVKSRTNTRGTNLVESLSNDVLTPSSGETALDIATASCIKESGVLLGGDLIVLRLNENQEGEFFAYYLSHGIKFEIAKLAQGNSVVHLYGSHLKKLVIKFPLKEEQQKIASFLASLDTFIESKQNQITLVTNWKKGLMQRMFV